MSFKITGLDKIQRNLKDLQDKARKLDGKNQVQFSDLFPPAFLRRYTHFASLADLEEKANQQGFVISSKEDWDNLPLQEWDAFIAEHTSFGTWQDMLNKGATEWTSRQLGFK